MYTKIDGAVKGLKELKSAFDMKGSNAITIERAIVTLENSKKEINKLNQQLDSWP